MSRYVDADKASIYLNSAACEQIKLMPTVDVQEIRHGEWLIFYGDYTTAECSLCGLEATFDEEANGALFEGFKQFYKYCPNCGARMEDEDE